MLLYEWNMKKKFYFLVLFLFGGFAFADCDIEVSTKPLSFYQAKNINFGTLYYKESLVFRYTGYICDISNFNYFLLDEKLGFYDSLNVIYKDRLGLELALGPCFKFYEGLNVDLYGRLGFHSSFFFEYLNLGLESGIGLKFFNKKRVSPVAGLNLSFDFFTSGNAVNAVDSLIIMSINNIVPSSYTADGVTHYSSVSYDPRVYRYLCFCVMPYIGVSVNF